MDSFLNFRLHDFPLPEIIALNSVNNLLCYKNRFDAIICDPPYGIRAKVKNSTEIDSFENDVIVKTKGGYEEIVK